MTDYEYALDFPLACPRCGDAHLHQGAVTVWIRDGEDSQTGMVARVYPDLHVGIDTKMAECPSPRRDAVSIEFECESCRGTHALEFFQHKGLTGVDWTQVEGGGE